MGYTAIQFSYNGLIIEQTAIVPGTALDRLTKWQSQLEQLAQ